MQYAFHLFIATTCHAFCSNNINHRTKPKRTTLSVSLCNSSFLISQNVSRDLIKLVKSIGFSDIPASAILHAWQTAPSAGDSPDVLPISQCHSLKYQLSHSEQAVVKAALTAGLYPHVAKTTCMQSVDSATYRDRQVCVAQTTQGVAQVHPASVNRLVLWYTGQGAEGLT